MERTNGSAFSELATSWLIYDIIPFWHLRYSFSTVRQASWNEVTKTKTKQGNSAFSSAWEFLFHIYWWLYGRFWHLDCLKTYTLVALSLYSEEGLLNCKSLSPVLRHEHRTSELHRTSVCETSFCFAVFCCVLVQQ